MVLSFLASEIVDNLVLGAQTTLIGLGVVFLMLFLLVGVLKIFEKMFNQKKAALGPEKASAPVETVSASENDEELQAAIMATLNVVLSEEASKTGSDKKYAVKSIRKI
ncbi:MAG: OadG family protein [Eubacteriales bacterium]|nr:OadG family protein [Faecalibacterium sp.]MDD7571347.1 OadG family protein [Faecalibacterium sp.]MDY3256248.1 OadG family protein [Eubacteriales bacterium]MDY6150582.1 OadG family protein [Eubacteriales bacterium]CCY03784.1 unknown [Faecalibacterium sp. CAG:1138]